MAEYAAGVDLLAMLVQRQLGGPGPPAQAVAEPFAGILGVATEAIARPTQAALPDILPLPEGGTVLPVAGNGEPPLSPRPWLPESSAGIVHPPVGVRPEGREPVSAAGSGEDETPAVAAGLVPNPAATAQSPVAVGVPAAATATAAPPSVAPAAVTGVDREGRPARPADAGRALQTSPATLSAAPDPGAQVAPLPAPAAGLRSVRGGEALPTMSEAPAALGTSEPEHAESLELRGDPEADVVLKAPSRTAPLQQAAAPTVSLGPDPGVRQASGPVSQSANQFTLAQTPASPEWADGVGERLLWLARQGEHTARIRLNPPDLGALEVRVSVADDKASVWFSASHHAVRESLESAMPRLREMLASQGLDLVDVNIAGHGGGRGDGAPAGESALPPASPAPGGGPAADDVPETPVLARRGLVDAYV